ncbi:MAG: hypothetical protein AYK19_19955 [Theionarchaea archaeon DG-70-1]|nr:MAG: hypothetical protein AYK19_19955 [Theionarchaea archaeon DG-70-1]
MKKFNKSVKSQKKTRDAACVPLRHAFLEGVKKGTAAKVALYFFLILSKTTSLSCNIWIYVCLYD